MNEAPQLDSRSRAAVAAQLRGLVEVYVPEWRPQPGQAGHALIDLFSRFMEIVLERNNRLLDKNFLAFLDTVGVTPLAPRPARVAVQFAPAAGTTRSIVVPAGSRVATAPTDSGAAVSFETEGRLVVGVSQLVRIVGVDPDEDRMSDYPVSGSILESPVLPFSGTEPLEHSLYVGDSRLRSDGGVEVRLQFSLTDEAVSHRGLFVGLAWETWTGDDWQAVDKECVFSGAVATVTLMLPANVSVLVDGAETFWVRARRFGIRAGEAVPEVQSWTIETSASDRELEHAAANDALLDPTRALRPFGERPAFDDTFYLASSEVFSKEGARVTLELDIALGPDNPDALPEEQIDVTLRWEFWDGEQWARLGESSSQTGVAPTDDFNLSDASRAFTSVGEGRRVEFDCPQVEATTLFGEESRWLRVRLVKGGYGSEARLQLSDPRRFEDWQFSPATFAAPVLTRVSASYRDSIESTAPAETRIFQDFSFESLSTTEPFTPFRPSRETSAALYLGFDRVWSPEPVQVYLPSAESVAAVGDRSELVWEYATEAGWKVLTVDDETEHFSRSGMVSFIGPSDAALEQHLGSELYWIRALRSSSSGGLYSLGGVFPNSVWAVQQSSTEQVLGSSSGEPSQSFALPRPSVLPEELLEVVELERPSEDELEQLHGQSDVELVRELTESGRRATGFAVLWRGVEDLRESGSDDRHYSIDRESGRVSFGDGVRGRVPPAGRDNIRLRHYATTAGSAGNTAASTVTVLRTALSGIDRVHNPEPAAGGADPEPVERIRERGPATLKHLERAVTVEDYEALALQASIQVARARCSPAETQSEIGQVGLVLVPESSSPAPAPSTELVREVSLYLEQRQAVGVSLQVGGPEYVDVSVSATVVPVFVEQADRVHAAVNEALDLFLHPLHGGHDGRGWPFGRNVYLSEVAAVIEGVEGVDYSRDIAVNGSDRVSIDAHALPSSSTHDIVVTGA